MVIDQVFKFVCGLCNQRYFGCEWKHRLRSCRVDDILMFVCEFVCLLLALYCQLFTAFVGENKLIPILYLAYILRFDKSTRSVGTSKS